MMAVQPDGKIVIVGEGLDDCHCGPGPRNHLKIARLRSNGTLDPSFGSGGIVTRATSGSADGLLVDRAGRIVVLVGQVLWRFTSNGRFDANFTYAPLSTIDPGFYPVAVAEQVRDGVSKYVVTGTSDMALFNAARFNNDGSQDAHFGIGGVARVPQLGTNGNTGGWWGVKNIVIEPATSKIVLAGSVDDSEDERGAALVRFTADGRTDRTLGRFGYVRYDTDHWMGDFGRGLALTGQGKIVVTGSDLVHKPNVRNYNFGVSRFHTDGSPDTSFSIDGHVETDLRGYRDEARSLAIQPDGKVVVGGSEEKVTYDSDGRLMSVEHHFGLVRYLPTGALDRSFGNGGRVVSNFGGDGLSVAVYGNRILIAGGRVTIPLTVARYTG